MSSTKHLVAIPVSGTTMPVLDTSKIPQVEKENIGQLVFDAVQQAFQDPAFRADYERWKAERTMKKG